MKKEFVIGRRLIKTHIISILRPIREKSRESSVKIFRTTEK